MLDAKSKMDPSVRWDDVREIDSPSGPSFQRTLESIAHARRDAGCKSKMGPSVTRRASVESRREDDVGIVIPAQAGTQCLLLSVYGSNASRWVPA